MAEQQTFRDHKPLQREIVSCVCAPSIHVESEAIMSEKRSPCSKVASVRVRKRHDVALEDAGLQASRA